MNGEPTKEQIHKRWLEPIVFTISCYPVDWVWLCDEPYVPAQSCVWEIR